MARIFDLNVLADRVPFEEAIGPRAGYGPNEAATVREKVLRRIGEPPVEILGFGEMGVVYGLPSGKVMKLTRDPTEVKALSKLIGGFHPNIVQVFDAFYAVEDPTAKVPRGVGVVVREAIDGTMVGHDVEVARAFMMALATGETERQRTFDICAGMAAYRLQLAAEKKELGFLGRELLTQVDDALLHLRGLGICSYDFGPGNIGVILGRPVLYDIGVASVEGDDPDII